MSTNIVILAAGKSTRMKSSIPKVMHLIAERPALGYILETAKSANLDKIILVTSPSMENVRKYADSESSNIVHAIQEKPLGTGDAVKSALKHIDNDGHTIITYGDTPFVSLDTLNQIKGKDLTLVGFNTEEPNKYGRLVSKSNNLLEIIEYNDATDKERLITNCNSGIYSIKNSYLHHLIPLIESNNAKAEFYLTDIVKLATQHDLICPIVNIHESEVTGFNTREDLALAQKFMQKKIKSRLMNEGVTMITPKSSYIAYDFEAGNDITIYPNTFIGTKVKLGNNVIIRSFSHIEGATIDDDVIIGPFARIRPDTHIEKKAKIGNFVEIKNSEIKQASKISHLSYIGDTTMGSNSNIGAGTITCNFDGIKTKSKTIIGNEVSIGSNSCLIAPITIADRAFIAAGSVITNNLEEDDLAFGRAKQVTLKKKAKALRNKNDQ
jgi:bifunctional UDP-N-acetylglucosamine pyrophosphorylase / glucosamine-1-phosphate N-acetyltransferase